MLLRLLMLILLLLPSWSQEAHAEEITPPRLIESPEVSYPPGLDRGEQLVELSIVIGPDGRVSEVSVVRGDEPFASLARAAILSSSFSPALSDGRPFAAEVPMSWRFPSPPIRLRGSAPVGSTVRIAERQTTVDESGRFVFRNLPPGPATLLVDNRVIREVEIPSSGWIEVALGEPNERRQADVVGRYRPASSNLQRGLDAEDIRAVPGALGDPVRALQALAGVTRPPFDAGWVLVRGGNPDDTALFVDDVRVPLLFHLGGLTSILHPELIERVSLSPGSVPVRYTSSLSGAVNLESRSRPPDQNLLVAGVNLIYAHAFADLVLGKRAGLSLAVRRSYLDAILTPILGREEARIAPRFWDGAVKLSLDGYQLMLLAVSDEADVPGETGTASTVSQRAVQLQGRGSARLGRTTISGQHWVASQVRTYENEPDKERILDWFAGGRIELENKIGTTYFRAGLETEASWFEFDRNQVMRGRASGRIDPYIALGATSSIPMELGLRLDTLFVEGQLPRVGLSPRFTTRLPLTGSVSALLEAGRIFKEPRKIWLFGLPDGAYLPLQRADTASAGVAINHRDWLRGELASFYRWSRGLSGVERDGTVGTLDAEAVGAEASIEVARAQTTASLTVQVARSRFREGYDKDWENGRYTVPAQLVLGVSHRYRGWLFSARFRYTSGYLLDDRADTAWDILRQAEVPLEAVSGRLAPYHALDIKIARRFRVGQWLLDAYLDVLNGYNRRVAEPTYNGIDDVQPVYGFGLPVLPVFGIDLRGWPRTPRARQRDL